jgi:cell division transport system permease protein
VRFRFILSETFQGLRRNLTMTFAVIITVAVSLTLFGAGPARARAGRLA